MATHEDIARNEAVFRAVNEGIAEARYAIVDKVDRVAARIVKRLNPRPAR